MTSSREYIRLLRRVAGIVFLIFFLSGCAEMMQQGGPQPAPASGPEAIRRDDQLKRYKDRGKDYVSHKVRPGETLSGIAMSYYDTYLTDVDYHVPQRAFMTPEVSRRYDTAEVRRMGKVSDVVARLNKLDSSRLKVGGEIILPRIQGLPFRAGMKPEDRKPDEKEQPKATAALPAPEKPERNDPENDFRNLLDEGRRYFEQNGYAAAIAPLSRAHRLRPRNSTVRDYLYRSYFALGEAALAKKEYLRAAQAFGEALKYNEACKACREKKAASEARYKDLHYKNGIRHFENEQLVEAIEEWEKVRKIDPDYQNVQKNIRLARRLLKRLGEMEKEKSR
jgi:tetratricopeptide (TPR) repeat protein